MARFREQPQHNMKCQCCVNQRRFEGRTMQERRAGWGTETANDLPDLPR
jgi:hypothetical protein